MGDLLKFPEGGKPLKKGIFWQMWWSWIMATRGRYYDVWDKQISREAHKVCLYHF